MTSPLVPCPACARHVRAAEAHCPFCAAALPAGLAATAVPPSTQPLTRAATFMFATTLALAGCSSTTGTADSATPDDAADVSAAPDITADAPRDMGNVQPPYGVPPGDRKK